MVDWESVKYILKNEGLKSLSREAIYYNKKTYNRYLSNIKNLDKNSTNVYEKEWDLLIVLDSCRFDLMKKLANNYRFINKVESIYSVGAQSLEWMENTFDNNECCDTTYITSNMFSNKLDKSKFNNLEKVKEVWKYGWDNELGVTPPRKVSEEVIRHHRDNRNSRTIAHYMQPHEPFIEPQYTEAFFSNNTDFKEEVKNWGQRKGNKPIWEHLRDGDISKTEVWEDYKNNLELALNEVSVLLNNVEFDNVVITSDHGNAMGENGFYGHPYGVHDKYIRTVPWIEVGGTTDNQTIKPKKSDKKPDGKSVEEKLRALGYKE